MSHFEPEKYNDYAPNAVQREFIRLCAQKHWYLAFADMDHSRPQLPAFAYNEQTVEALHEGGKEIFFLENNPENQYYYDWLRRDEDEERRKKVITLNIDKIAQGRRSISGLWLSDTDRDKLIDIFEISAKHNKSVRFVGADERLRNTDEYKKLKLRVKIAAGRAFAWEQTLKLGQKLFGTESHLAHSIARIFTRNPEKMILGVAGDDRKTVDYIESFGVPAAIMFGAGHFQTLLDDPKNPRLLGSLLDRNGKSLCVLQLFQNMNHRAQVSEERNLMPEKEYGPVFNRPDAELFVEKTPGIKYGIRIVNPAFKPLYDQAVRNVQAAGLTPQEMTRQFLPS